MKFINKETLLWLGEVIFLIIFVVLPIRVFFLEPFFVKGDSMVPNFYSWDYIIIDKFSYHFQKPKRGDVIVLKPPFDSKVYYIKRIIGLPGEIIILDGSNIIIKNKENPNGFVLKEDYISNNYFSTKMEVHLKEGEYFVLGDNREVSYDSRRWGPLSSKNIVGKVLFHFSFVKLWEKINNSIDLIR